MHVHANSHVDHGLTEAQWAHVFDKFGNRNSAFVETLELPSTLGTVLSALYGPTAGDSEVSESEVFYERRGDRPWLTRFVRRPRRPTPFVRVIAGPGSEPCASCLGRGKAYAKVANKVVKALAGLECFDCGGLGKVEQSCVLYTAYGVSSQDAPLLPREPGDIRLEAERLTADAKVGGFEWARRVRRLATAVEDAEAFWSDHALAYAEST